jgi:2-keto-4-pentenoate hydratase/2-oxohepta-3-ene-1,7-dioic acid hydratase in catechol pathway
VRLCRFEHQGRAQVGFYQDDSVIPLAAVAPDVPPTDSLLPLLPGGDYRQQAKQWESAAAKAAALPVGDVKLLVPVPSPTKVLLLAGNYSAHIEEGGGRAEERAKTFPYVFMKPPLTTLTNPGDPVRIPAVSPKHIDWELELGVIIGKRCRGVSEQDALAHVAGYTVVNDISDRKFRPNPQRNKRDKDEFFDWLHGKWHDTFCPMGPCVLPAEEVDDPQTFKLDLRVNGQTEQDASTADMVFPVAAVVAFIAGFVTLESGDVISTGTPSGVGAAKNKFLKAGDVLEAEIGRIGILRNPVVGP